MQFIQCFSSLISQKSVALDWNKSAYIGTTNPSLFLQRIQSGIYGCPYHNHMKQVRIWRVSGPHLPSEIHGKVGLWTQVLGQHSNYYITLVLCYHMDWSLVNIFHPASFHFVEVLRKPWMMLLPKYLTIEVSLFIISILLMGCMWHFALGAEGTLRSASSMTSTSCLYSLNPIYL